MNSWMVALLLLAVLSLAYQQGWSFSRKLATPEGRLHSRPAYHGSLVAIWTIAPALLILGLWALFGTSASRAFILANLPAEIVDQGGAALQSTIQRVRAIASGFGVAGEVQPYEAAAGEALRRFQIIASATVLAAAAAFAGVSLYFARRRIATRLRARNEVERLVRYLLLACSGVAILTTLGIVLSLVFEAARFFTFVSPIDFFFGTVWNPRFSTTGAGSGQYGLLPLLWGTVMVAAIAMFVALPIGLMTAIYLSQYAKPRVRSIVKPMIEILAGIPTIV